MNAIKHFRRIWDNQPEPIECQPSVCAICQDYSQVGESLRQTECPHCGPIRMHLSCWQRHLDQTITNSPMIVCPLCQQSLMSFQITYFEFRRIVSIYWIVIILFNIFHLVTSILYLGLGRSSEHNLLGYLIILGVTVWYGVYFGSLTRKFFYRRGYPLCYPSRILDEQLPLTSTVSNERLINPDPTIPKDQPDWLAVRHVVSYYLIMKTWGLYILPAWMIVIICHATHLDLRVPGWVNILLIYFPIVCQCLWVIVYITIVMIALLCEVLAIGLLFLTKLTNRIRIRQWFLYHEIDLAMRLESLIGTPPISPGSPVSLTEGPLLIDNQTAQRLIENSLLDLDFPQANPSDHSYVTADSSSPQS